MGLDTGGGYVMIGTQRKGPSSLALAGIMAVSMLAGCKDGGNSNSGSSSENTNTASNFTEAVLRQTNPKTSAMLSVDSKVKLDEAVAYAAKINVTNEDTRLWNTIHWADNNWVLTDAAKQKMAGAEDGFRAENQLANIDVSESAGMWTDGRDLPVTYWTVGMVSTNVDDATLANMIADMLDEQDYAVDANDYTYDYTVRVAKAVAENKDLSSADDDYIVVGISLTCNRTAVKY